MSGARTYRRPVVPAVAIFCVLTCTLPVPAQDESRLEQSRALTAGFAAELQTALQSGMAAGGPAAAIAACKDEAPAIASRLSEDSGARVGRTSLRVRNPANRADEWQRRALVLMEEDPSRTEVYESSPDGGFRYMKAIPTGALCLNCHGTVLAPDIAAKIDEAYPDDEARGYYLGDVRGAFTITWPES